MTFHDIQLKLGNKIKKDDGKIAINTIKAW